MDDATLTDESADTATLAIEGPRAEELIRELTGLELAKVAMGAHQATAIKSSGASIPCRVLRHSLFGFPGAELLLPRESLTAAWQTLAKGASGRGGSPVGYRALEMLRLEAGIPWFGADFEEHHIPHEAGVESTHISFTKGCYTGQEIVERVRSRGHVNRRLTRLKFDTSETPKPGAAVFASQGTGSGTELVEAGEVTSAAFSPLAGRAIGMAYLRRESLKPGITLQCENATAEVMSTPQLAKIGNCVEAS
jgi:folate-binding protein YgfZ